MRSIITLMDTIAAIPTVDWKTRSSARYLSFALQYPRGIYRWLH